MEKINNLQFLSFVSEDKEIREASTESNKTLEEYKIEVSMRKDIFEVLLKVKNKKENLDKVEERLLNKMLQ